MGRPRKSEDEKKQRLPIYLPGWMIRWLRSHGQYSPLIERLLRDYIEKVDKRD